MDQEKKTWLQLPVLGLQMSKVDCKEQYKQMGQQHNKTWTTLQLLLLLLPLSGVILQGTSFSLLCDSL
jgi:hypothetical protein